MISSASFDLPIFQSKVHDPGELPSIVGYEHEIVGDRSSGYHEIVRTYGRAGALQIAPDDPVVLGTAIIKRNRDKGSKEALEQPNILGRA